MSQITSADSSFPFVTSPPEQADYGEFAERVTRVNVFALASMPPQEENWGCKLRRNTPIPLVPPIIAFIKNED